MRNALTIYAEASAKGHFREIRHVRELLGGVFALFLHYRPAGLSLATLRELCVAAKVHRALALGLLAYLRFLGFVEPLPKGRDRRQQLFAPTARMIAVFKERLLAEIILTSDLDPDIAAIRERYEEPAIFPAFVEGLAVNLVRAGRGDVIYEEPLRCFSHRTNGQVLLYQLLALDRDVGHATTGGVIHYRTAMLARTARLSRIQVIRLIQDGVDANLLERVGDHAVRATPKLQEALRNFFAAQALAYGACARWAIGMADGRREAA